MSFRAFINLMNAAPQWESVQQFAVLSAIASFQNEKFGDWAWPSIASVSRKVKLSERQTSRVLQELEHLGLLVVSVRSAGRNRTRNRYRLLIANHDIGDMNERADGDMQGSDGDADDTNKHDAGDGSMVTPVTPELLRVPNSDLLNKEGTRPRPLKMPEIERANADLRRRRR